MMIGFDSFYDHLKNFVMGSDPIKFLLHFFKVEFMGSDPINCQEERI